MVLFLEILFTHSRTGLIYVYVGEKECGCRDPEIAKLNRTAVQHSAHLRVGGRDP